MRTKFLLTAALSAVAVLLFFAGPLGAQPGNMTRTGAKSASAKDNPDAIAEFPEINWTFEKALEGDEVAHVFKVRNRGTAILDIQKVRTG